MTRYEIAKDLAARGFHVFPVVRGRKLPAIKNFPENATRDPHQIHQWFAITYDNIGISTSRFGDDKALLVIDVDNKNGKNGDAELLKLELEGYGLPDTFEQRTPTGGRHLVFWCDTAVRQGVNVLGPGLDIRSRGGYIVGAGSAVAAGLYSTNYHDVAEAPSWLIDMCKPREDVPDNLPSAIEDDLRSVTAWLMNDAPISRQGEGGNQTAFTVACKLKDKGVEIEDAKELMGGAWNARCEPPWSLEELDDIIEHAYRYGQEPIGSKSAKAEFAPVDPIYKPLTDEEKEKLSPVEIINSDHALLLAGGSHCIMWETVDADGNYEIKYMKEPAFHAFHAHESVILGDGKQHQVSKLWMKNSEQRKFKGLAFKPGGTKEEMNELKKRGYHNLWRGFKVEPWGKEILKAPPEARQAVDMFMQHAKENVCGGDEKLFQWLIGYFAHLIQKPWEKPLVALVFRGGKGVGKNALVDRVGHLLGNHYLLTSNRRYLVGNFNGHLENCLLLALDEAFWSGDKHSEGTLKDLITGNKHVIERKGQETYTVGNLTRVVVIGNEDWLVPASQDERRFAVFDVGDGRKQDRDYFRSMREGMERGGYRLLLRVLQDWDVSEVDVNDAPATRALADQKIESLEPFFQWWFECLCDGRLVGSDFETSWEEECDKERLRSAFYRYLRERNIRARAPESIAIGKMLKKCLPSVVTDQKRRDGDKMVNVYRFPPLAIARQQWCKFIGHDFSWSGT